LTPIMMGASQCKSYRKSFKHWMQKHGLMKILHSWSKLMTSMEMGVFNLESFGTGYVAMAPGQPQNAEKFLLKKPSSKKKTDGKP